MSVYVSKDRKIIGIVTSDDVFDVAEEEATEDIHHFGGHSALEESYFQTPLFTMIKKRFGGQKCPFWESGVRHN